MALHIFCKEHQLSLADLVFVYVCVSVNVFQKIYLYIEKVNYRFMLKRINRM